MTVNEKLDILLKNLSVFKEREALANEARRLTAKNIACELCSDDSLSYESLWETFKFLVPDATAEEEILFFEKALKPHKLSAQIKSACKIGSADSVGAGSHGKIAFVRNSFTDLAFEELSRKINSAKPYFVSSFSDACESVADGECEFCILPIENTSDGKMAGFYVMIDRYELKICHACDIEDERAESVRYAILGKGCTEPGERQPAELIFEFSIISEDGEFINRLLSAAERCPASPISISCSPMPYYNSLKRYRFSFKTKHRGSLLLRAFLRANYPSYTPIGLYSDPSDK